MRFLCSISVPFKHSLEIMWYMIYTSKLKEKKTNFKPVIHVAKHTTDGEKNT